MNIKERFQKGREALLPSIMRHELKPKKRRKFSPVKIRIGGEYFVSYKGQMVFENQTVAKTALGVALDRAVAGRIQNSNGVFENAIGLRGVIKLIFNDVHLNIFEASAMRRQFRAYFFKSVKFEPSTTEEFLLNNHNVEL